MVQAQTLPHVLVTGGSGFLGSGIVKAILKKHPTWQVTVLDLQPPAEDILKRVVAFLKVDVSSRERVNEALTSLNIRIDLVVHCAAIVPARNLRYSKNSRQWEKVKAINYGGTRNVLDAAMAQGCMNFVYTSSCTAIIDDLEHDYYHMDETLMLGRAKLHYGRSKVLAEQYLFDPGHAEKGLKACALRPATIIGPGDRAVIGIMYDLIAKGETCFIVGDGDNLYDMMYVDNAVHAHVLAVENLLTTQTAAGHAMFISNDEPVYFWDFLAAVWAEFGHVPPFRIHIPVGVAWLAGLVLEWMTWLTGRVSTLDRGSVQDGVRVQYSNNSKARDILGYVPPVGLAEGLRRSCDDYKQYLAEQAALKKQK